MPMYDYRCLNCGARSTILKKIGELDRLETCPECRFAMTRQISAPRIQVDYPGYKCPITDKWIEGRRAHTENLKQHGCRVFEPGEKEAFQARRVREEAEFDARVEESAGHIFEAMSHEKKEAIACAIDNGLDVSVERG